jgi:hypothetical protein
MAWCVEAKVGRLLEGGQRGTGLGRLLVGTGGTASASRHAPAGWGRGAGGCFQFECEGIEVTGRMPVPLWGLWGEGRQEVASSLSARALRSQAGCPCHFGAGGGVKKGESGNWQRGKGAYGWGC